MFSKIGMADGVRQTSLPDESGLRTRRSLDFGTSFLSTLFATTIIVAYSVILRIASQWLVGGYLYIFYLKKDMFALRSRRSLHFGTPFLSTLFAMAITIAYSVFLSHWQT